MASFFDRPFDSTKVEPQTAFKPIPEGNYLALIKEASEEPTKKRDGKMLVLGLKILKEGPGKGRELKWRLNLENPNPQAVEIGHAQLSAVCRAIGVAVPKRCGDFVGKSLEIKVKVTRRNDKPDELTNEVAGVVLPDAAPAAGAPAAAQTDEKPPWG